MRVFFFFVTRIKLYDHITVVIIIKLCFFSLYFISRYRSFSYNMRYNLRIEKEEKKSNRTGNRGRVTRMSLITKIV